MASAKTCAKCQAPLPPGARFCEACGQPVPAEAPATISCPKCGAQLPPGTRFCGQCGQAIGGQQVTAPPPPPPPPPPAAGPAYTAPSAPPAPAYTPPPPTKAKGGSKTGCIIAVVAVVFLALVCLVVSLVWGLPQVKKLLNQQTTTPTGIAVKVDTAQAIKTATRQPTAQATTAVQEPTAKATEKPTAEPTEKPTAEPTEEPSEEPTAEPTPEDILPKGELLFEDDLATNDNGWREGESEDVGAWFYFEDGQYHVEMTEEGWTSWSNPEDASGTYRDLVLEVNATALSGAEDASYGLLFRYVDGDNFYHFEVASDGTFRLEKNEDDEWTDISDWVETPAINPMGETNHLAVVAQGSTIDLYINGTLVGSYEDDSFSRGDVGLVVATYSEGGAHIVFDSFRVYKVK